MKRYRLDPKKPPQVTPEEESRPDYSDIPPLDDEFFPKPSKLGRPPNTSLPFGWTLTFWAGYEPMTGAIRPGSIGFCRRQWKARPAKISARHAAEAIHPTRAAGRAVHNSEFRNIGRRLSTLSSHS